MTIVVFLSALDKAGLEWKRRLSMLGCKVYVIQIGLLGDAQWSGLTLIEIGSRIRNMKEEIPVFVHGFDLMAWARNDFQLPLSSEDQEQNDIKQVQLCNRGKTFLLPAVPFAQHITELEYVYKYFKLNELEIGSSMFKVNEQLEDARDKKWSGLQNELARDGGTPWAVSYIDGFVVVYFIQSGKESWRRFKWMKHIEPQKASVLIDPPLGENVFALLNVLRYSDADGPINTNPVLNYSTKCEHYVQELSLDWRDIPALHSWHSTNSKSALFWNQGSSPEQKVLMEQGWRIGKILGSNETVPLFGWYKAVCLTVDFCFNGQLTVAVYDLQTKEIRTWNQDELDKWWIWWCNFDADMVLTCYPSNSGCIALLKCLLQTHYPSEQPYEVIRWPSVHWNLWDSLLKYSSVKVPRWTISQVTSIENAYLDNEIHKDKTNNYTNATKRVQLLADYAKENNICENIISHGILAGSISYCDLENTGTIDLLKALWFTGPWPQKIAFPMAAIDSSEMGGGLIKDLNKEGVKLYTDVFDVDLSSAYPYIIIERNISPECSDGESIIHYSMGSIPVLVQHLVQERAKATNDPTKRALKLMSNELFGFIGRYFKKLGNMITSECKERIEKVVSNCKSGIKNSVVLVISTDGILLEANGSTKNTIETVLKKQITFPIKVSERLDAVLVNHATSTSILQDNCTRIVCKGMACCKCSQPLIVRQMEHRMAVSLLKQTTPILEAESIQEIWNETYNKLFNNATEEDLAIVYKIDSTKKTYLDVYMKSHLHDPWFALPSAVKVYHCVSKVTDTEADCILKCVPVGFTVSPRIYLRDNLLPIAKTVLKASKRRFEFLEKELEDE